MEQISRMAAEVNKLIGSNLLSGDALYLPEIGSLYIIESSEGLKKVDFSSSEQGSSLIDIIMTRASCTSEQANEIFSRWLTEVRNPSAIVIKGVGELRGKSFVMAEYFAAQLNPTPAKRVEVVESPKVETDKKIVVVEPKKVDKPMAERVENQSNKRSGKGLWIAVVIIFIAVCGYFTFNSIKESNEEKARIAQIAAEKASEQRRIADSIALAQTEAKRAADAALAVAPNQAPRFMVVYGVFEVRSNVDAAIATINKQFGNGSAHEYPYGRYTLVSMFESEVRSECQNFLMANYSTYPDAWVYGYKQ
ncbi:MAG: hypothetical protein SNH73_08370 [Rikenellaceae bacterium]